MSPQQTRRPGELDLIMAAPLPKWRVIGLDLSLTGTGISDGRWSTTIETTGHNSDRLATREARIAGIAQDVMDHLSGAHLVVVETHAPSSRTGHVWDRAGLWWRVVHRLLAAEVPVALVSPSGRPRYATGKGRAKKEEVMLAAARRYPRARITNDNEADAVILAAMGRDWVGDPIATVPQTHRAALSGVEWPENIAGGSDA